MKKFFLISTALAALTLGTSAFADPGDTSVTIGVKSGNYATTDANGIGSSILSTGKTVNFDAIDHDFGSGIGGSVDWLGPSHNRLAYTARYSFGGCKATAKWLDSSPYFSAKGSTGFFATSCGQMFSAGNGLEIGYVAGAAGYLGSYDDVTAAGKLKASWHVAPQLAFGGDIGYQHEWVDSHVLYPSSFDAMPWDASATYSPDFAPVQFKGFVQGFGGATSHFAPTKRPTIVGVQTSIAL